MPIEKENIKLLIEKDKAERVSRCQVKIQKALEEEQCILDVSVVLKTNQVIPQVSILAQ